MSKLIASTSIFDEIVPAGEVPDIWGEFYLPVQWQNLLGQWEFPLEYWGGSMLEFEHEVVQVRHQSKMVDGMLLDSISVAPFASKVHWGYIANDGKYIMAHEPMDDLNPWRSRVHILALLKESESMLPVILTAGSNTGKHLLSNVGQGQRRISNMLKRIGYGDRPPHLFWMEMVAGKPIEVGEGEAVSTICPPVAVAPANLHKMSSRDIAEYLTSIYVGNDIQDIFADGLFEQGQEWAVRQPERLIDDTNGGDNTATDATVLADGSLYIPDLSQGSKPQWRDCALSIPGLFGSEEEASNALARVLRSAPCRGRKDADQWECWREELERRWADAQEQLQEIALEIENRQ